MIFPIVNSCIKQMIHSVLMLICLFCTLVLECTCKHEISFLTCTGPTFPVSIDTSTASTGTYIVTVSGSTSTGESIAVGEATFSVPGAWAYNTEPLNADHMHMKCTFNGR